MSENHDQLVLALFFETGSHYVAQAGLELSILLPQPPECWDSKSALPRLAFKFCCNTGDLLLRWFDLEFFTSRMARK
jgi:hypothetical protein